MQWRIRWSKNWTRLWSCWFMWCRVLSVAVYTRTTLLVLTCSVARHCTIFVCILKHHLPPSDVIWGMMIVWRIRGKIIRTVLCYMLCMTVVHSDMHTYEQFLKMSVGLGLDLFFVHLLRFSILVFWFGLAILFLCCFLLLCLVQFVHYYAKILAGKNVIEMTYFYVQWDVKR